MRRAVKMLGAALLAAVVTGCAAAAEPPVWEPTVVDPPAPRPVGVQDPAPVTDGPAVDDSCDPRESLRPLQALPHPARCRQGPLWPRSSSGVGCGSGWTRTPTCSGSGTPTGELAGFDIDLAREIARALFGDPDRIQLVAVSSADRIPAIESGQVDLVVRTMTMTCDRWRRVAFSTEYFTAGQRVLVRRDSPVNSIDDLGGEKVCAAAGSTSLQGIAAAASGPVPVSAVDWTDCLVLLQQGEVAAVSTDDSILAGMAAQDPTTHVVGRRFTTEPYGIAMATDAQDLVRFVNAVLERLRSDGTWTELYERWLGALGPPPAPPTARYRD